VPPSGDRSIDKEWQWVDQVQTLGHGVIHQGETEYDPDLGWKLRAGYRQGKIHINSHGQRQTGEWPREHTPGKLRILFLGDSYTFGYNVGNDECYPGVVQKRFLPEAEIINYGVPGYGTDQQILLYEKYGAEFSPDIVVLGFFTPDLFRNDMTFFNYFKPVFTLEDGKLVPPEGTIPSPTDTLRLYASGEKRIRGSGSYVLNHLLRQVEDIRRDRVNENTREWPVTERILERFNEQVRQNGATPFLLIMPNREILSKEESASTGTGRLLIGLAKRLNMPYLDLIPALREKAKVTEEPLYAGHWTVKGHEAAAEALYQTLEKESLLQPKS
jgi:lysophospholipase L1-like esterase